MITITGTLVDPMQGVIPLASIRLTALSTTGEILNQMDATHTSDEAGLYTFPLENGRYLLEVLYTDEFHISGTVLVDSSTPSNISIQELIRYASPVVVTISSELPTVWETLFNQTINSDEWNFVDEHQVSLDGVYSNEQKTIHKNSEQYLAAENFSLSTGLSNQSTQLLSYSDNSANYALGNTQEFTTPILNGVTTFGIFQSSNGQEKATQSTSFTGSVGSVINDLTLTDIDVTHSSISLLGSAESTETLKLEQTYTPEGGAAQSASVTASNKSYKAGEGIHEGEVYTKEEIKYVDANDLVDALFEKGIRLKYSKNGNPIEGFQKLFADSTGINLTTQVDKSIIQGRDGVPLVEFDTEANEVNLFGNLTVNNPQDFKGADGSTLSWQYEYSTDKGLNNPWHVVYVEGDIWRKDSQVTLYADNTSELTGVIQYVKLAAQDGLVGDTYYLQTQYASEQDLVNNIWRSVYAVNDVWRRQREVLNETGIGDWREPERIRGSDGQDGWIPEFEVYYGSDGTAAFNAVTPSVVDWHKNLVNDDVYKYERTVWWYNQAAYQAARNTDLGIDWDLAVTGTYTTTPWVGATKIKPELGIDYGDKSFPLFLYTRSATNPTDSTVGNWSYNFVTKTATNISGNTAGWSQQLPPESNLPLWLASGIAFSKLDIDPSIDNWDVDLLNKNGVKFATAYLYQVTGSNVNSVSLPAETLTFEFATQKITATSSGNWQTTRPSSTGEGNKLWITVAPVTSSAEVLTENIVVNDWEDAVVASVNGTDGVSFFTLISSAPAYGVVSQNTFKKTHVGTNTAWNAGAYSAESYSGGCFSTAVFSEATGTEGLMFGISNDIGTSPHYSTIDYAILGRNNLLYIYEEGVFTLDTGVSYAPSDILTVVNDTKEVTYLKNGTVFYTSNNVPSGAYRFDCTADYPDISITGIAFGPSGASGTNGEFGSGSYIIIVPNTTSENSIATKSNSIKTSDFVSAVSKQPQNKDVLSYVNDSASDETLRFRLDYLYNGTTWENFIDVVDGNQLVHGTVAAEALVTETITTDKLAANVITTEKIVANVGLRSPKIEYVGSSHMRISAADGFGSSGQFIEWFGERHLVGDPADNIINYTNVTKSNAITYLTTDGDAYFGGTIISGALQTSKATSDLADTANVDISIGSNEGLIAVNYSVSLNSRYNNPYGSSELTTQDIPVPECIVVFQQYLGGVWVDKASRSLLGERGVYYSTYEPEGEGRWINSGYQSLNRGFTFYDSDYSSDIRAYRLLMTSRTNFMQGTNWTPSQRLSLTSSEG